MSRSQRKATLPAILVGACILAGVLCLLMSSRFVVKTYEKVPIYNKEGEEIGYWLREEKTLAPPGVVLATVGVVLTLGGFLALLLLDDVY